MYRLILIAFLFCFAQVSKAQTYVPFPTYGDTAVWFVSHYYQMYGGEYHVMTYGDTIFDGKEYTKIYQGTNDYYPGNYFAAIREENKVIYLRDVEYGNLNSDTVLFDFNAHVGDTTEWFTFYGGNSTVYEIDSVQLADGTYRKRFLLDNGYLEVIEGIGSNIGFIPEPIVGGGSTNTYCYFLNGDFVWTSWFGTTEIDCYTSTKQLKTDSNIKVFPNPVIDNLNIKFEDTEKRTLSVFNSLGKIVFNETSTQTDFQLNLQHLPKGFYILSIQTNAGTLTKKIMKH